MYRRQFGNAPLVIFALTIAEWKLGDRQRALNYNELVMQRLMNPSLDTASVTWHELSSMVNGAAYFEQAGQSDRAVTFWQRGFDIMTTKLDIDPDSIGMRLTRGSFHGFLGDRAAFLADEVRARTLMAETDVSPWELFTVAASYAHLGETDRAVEVLREQLRRGRLIELEQNLELLVPILDDPAYLEFRRE